MILALKFRLQKCVRLTNVVTRSVVTATQKSSEPITKPYEDIPSPPGGRIPVIGHTNYFVKKPYGFSRSWKNVEEMKKKFVPAGVEMIRLNMPLSNPEGNGKLLVIFDPGTISFNLLSFHIFKQFENHLLIYFFYSFIREMIHKLYILSISHHIQLATVMKTS
jgi:hypothetical protein